MEDLTKTQLILLTLLVSFVTSITTGIATVSLLQEVPVSQTINRVVERTVEKVAPSLTEISGKDRIITKETTVVVKEEDLITEVIAKNRKSLVRIYRDSKKNIAQVSTTTVSDNGFVSLGVVVSRDGMIVADASRISASGLYNAHFVDGSAAPLSVVLQDERWGIALLKTDEETVADTPHSVYQKVSFIDVASLKLGQTVIALGAEERDAVSIGIISGFLRDDASHASTTLEVKPAIFGIITDTSLSGVIAGRPIFNLFGEFIALSVSVAPGVSHDITANIIDNIIETKVAQSAL